MRKIRKRNIKKKTIIIGSLSLLLFLCVGYAAFSTNLNLNVKGNIVILKDLYVASFGSDTSGNGTRNKPYMTIQKAYNMAGNTASIHILDNIIQKDTINFDKNKEIILDSINNNSIIRDSSLTSTLLNITNGTTTFKNITFDGNNVEASDSLILVNDETYIENGSVFKNVNYSGESGATFRIINNILTMNGGEFYNNKSPNGGGSALYLERIGTLIINNGLIHDNTSKDGAIWSVGTITINGGKIYNNVSSQGGGGIFNNGNLTINNGEIYGNKADYGGGIANGYYDGYDTILTITGGKIYNNIASNYGGGIELHKPVIYSNTGGIIENNTPDNVYRVS